MKKTFILCLLSMIYNSSIVICCSPGIYSLTPGDTYSDNCILNLYEEYYYFNLAPSNYITNGEFSIHWLYAYNYGFWSKVYSKSSRYSGINCGYRCPMINYETSNSEWDSYHQSGSAADLQLKSEEYISEVSSLFDDYGIIQGSGRAIHVEDEVW